MAAPTIGYVLKMYPRLSETFVLNELLELERQGIRLHIFSLKTPDDGIFHGDVARLRAPVTYVPESRLSSVPAFARAHRQAFATDRVRYQSALRAVLRRPRPPTAKHFVRAGYIAPLLHRLGIRHLHAHFASTAGSVALHLNRLTGVPYSLTAHAKDIYRHDIDREQLVAKIRGASFTVTVSDFNKGYLSRLVPGSRIVRIYNGLDLDQFSPNGRARREPPLILGVGRLVEKKGFADLIHACALLRERSRRFRCAIVGKGPLEAALRSRVDELGLGSSLELSPPVSREELLTLYPQAAVVCAPCVVGSDGNRDGLPAVLVEAMALGVPVVATDVTGIPELVADGRTGTLVPQHDPHALAEAIERVLDDPDSAAALARTGREVVERDFDLHRNAMQLRSLFEQTLAR
jgi:colanic acid/amylovoran biosynthesis glycosyltransferase